MDAFVLKGHLKTNRLSYLNCPFTKLEKKFDQIFFCLLYAANLGELLKYDTLLENNSRLSFYSMPSRGYKIDSSLSQIFDWLIIINFSLVCTIINENIIWTIITMRFYSIEHHWDVFS